MYRKNMMSCCGWRESVPCPCHGHIIPFPGDSISFRLPRQPCRRHLAGKPCGAVPPDSLSFL
ncbi:MAG: hypothetical protein HFG77_19210 [Hungatella sp.]|nr:hypothetical protein [Hungatella sp.]